MNTSQENVHPVMAECAAEAARVARGVRTEQLSGPSHCTGWDLRTLVNHWVLYTSYGLEHRALREPLPEVLTGRDFTAGPGWAEDYAEQLQRAVIAWEKPEVWKGEIDLGGGTMPADDIATMIVKEMAVHGWDVAVATGQRYEISAEAARLILQVVEKHGALYRQYDGFADPVPVREDATVFERALALSGRNPELAH